VRGRRCAVVAGPGALQLLPWLREGDDGATVQMDREMVVMVARQLLHLFCVLT